MSYRIFKIITNDNHDLKKKKVIQEEGEKKRKKEELVLPVAFDCSVGWRTLKRN